MVESNNSGPWPNLYAPFRGLGQKLSNLFSPASDASSDEGAYRIRVELPGVPEDAIELTVEDGLLTVSGEKTETREDKGDTWYFSEREFGSFRRSFRLPADADAEKAEAHMVDGVLQVVVPRKAADAARGKRIAVKKG